MNLIDILNDELPSLSGWPIGRPVCIQSSIDGELYFYKNEQDARDMIPGEAYRPGIFLTIATNNRMANASGYGGHFD